MKNVLEWLENSASQFGDKTVYSCESNSITLLWHSVPSKSMEYLE